METLHYEDLPSPPRRSAGSVWNLLTAFGLLAILLLAGWFWLIYHHPYSGLNPFPPPTLPALIDLPTATPTPVGMLPPTWTPTATQPPPPTETPHPTATLPPTATFWSLLTPSPPAALPTEGRPPAGYPYVLKDKPLALPNIAHSAQGCAWLGVAGQVEDLRGGPKTQLIVVLGGSLGGRLVDPSGVKYSLTGVAPAYGPAGYEFVLADHPVASKGTLWIQLVDQTEMPLSEKVYFDTVEDCEKNLIVLSFKQVK